jgi:hypothetical protein
MGGRKAHGDARHHWKEEADRREAAGRIGGMRTAAQSEERSCKKDMC